jgi:hypothetical protein
MDYVRSMQAELQRPRTIVPAHAHGDGDDNTSNQQVQHPYEFNILVNHQQKL